MGVTIGERGNVGQKLIRKMHGKLVQVSTHRRFMLETPTKNRDRFSLPLKKKPLTKAPKTVHSVR